MCDDELDIKDGNVICRQLGYRGASKVYEDAHYGEGTGAILLDDLECSGHEAYIWDCPHVESADHNCDHVEDSSVDCH